MPHLYIVLTTDPIDAPARTFLTDRDKFPLEALLTTDLHKARIWAHYVGARRFVYRHPELAQFGAWRPARVPSDDAAKVIAARAVKVPLPAAPQPPRLQTTKPTRMTEKTIANRRPSIRSTKTDPNKRAGRAVRLKAGRIARRKLGKPRAGRRRRKATAGA